MVKDDVDMIRSVLLNRSKRGGGLTDIALLPKYNPNPIYITDKNGVIIYKNEASKKIFGNVKNIFTLLGEKLSARKSEIKRLTKGKEFLFQIHSEKNHFYVYSKDISELGKSKKLQEIIDNFTDANGELNRKGELIQLSNKAELLFNKKLNEIKGQRLSDFLNDQTAFNKLWKSFVNDKISMKCEVVISTQFGEKTLILQFFVQDNDKNVIEFVARDISKERRQEAEELLRTQALQERDNIKILSKNRMQIFRMTSHELKTPLTSMKMELEMFLEDAKITKKQKFGVINILRQLNNFNRLITDIVDLSKIQTHGLRLSIKKMDIKTLLDNIKVMFQNEKAKNNLLLNVKSEKIPLVFWDKYRIERALINLVQNAIKFTEKGSVTINVKKLQNFILISVTDTGIGIPKNEIEKIFEPFYQVDQSAVREKGGQGLGLSICKGIIEAHGGKITVDSTVGKGTTFTISLPIKVQQFELGGNKNGENIDS